MRVPIQSDAASVGTLADAASVGHGAGTGERNMISRSSRVMFEAKSHSVNESRRADPRNGVCLNSLYDNAVDRGLVTFFDDL